MIGNVWEFTADWYLGNYYERPPIGGWVNPSGPETGDSVTIRGGAWASNMASRFLRTTYRSEFDLTTRNSLVGFRCVYPADASLLDMDGDGLTAAQELNLGTALNDSDSDNDGILDFNEDADNDGVSNGDEIAAGTDPLIAAVVANGDSCTDHGQCISNFCYRSYCAPDGMAHVPAGDFLMGCDSNNDSTACNANPDEGNGTPRTITLTGYFIDIYEVTTAEYEACFEAGVCTSNGGANHEINWGAPYHDHPINNITYDQALTYCEWRGRTLPTEAQWEKAARGTQGNTNPWGNATASCDYAVMINGCGNGRTKAVGSIEAGVGPYGNYDMIGNVWEWTTDWYDANYYSWGPTSNPTGPASGSQRVLRGGAWNSTAAQGYLRSTFRSPYTPGNSSNSLIGFRCAKSL